MDGTPTLYLFALIGLLGTAAWFVFRQVLKTRRTEVDFSRLQQQLSQSRGSAEDHYRLGSIFLEKKLYAPAIAQFQLALKDKELTDPAGLALIHNALGYAYAAQEQYDLAIRQYKEALEQQPDYVTALNNLGFAYEKKQLLSQAIATYESVLSLEPGNRTAQRRSQSLQQRVSPST
ncbi:tetratricopeptide repeat protein [Synechococcus elongatus]|uniref:Tetratricopeptide repeat protein n=1 Tax=Synechococcus elongatus PCC 11802 TaxID=2283154 RepID=A0AAU6R544_SYNEL|nr:tetratricopeptide repeat protein [Synechococcus elongatus]QFZ92178.1 tetratricopeptide repeat protein [Synechococcus elongatus PCC 11802]